MPAKKKPPLDKAGILAFDDRPIEKFKVPEWGGREVRLRAPSMGDILRIQSLAEAEGGPELIRLGMVGEDGLPIFDAAEVDQLMSRNVGALNRIATRLAEMVGVTTTVSDEAGN